MTPEQIELAQRLVKHPAFWWTPGMDRLRWSDTVREWRYAPRSMEVALVDDDQMIPVLTDPATVGCLRELTRGALKDPAIYTEPLYAYRGGSDWEIVGWTVNPGYRTKAPTEGEALALAILGQP